MRRAVLAILSTAAGLVLLLSFKTHAISPRPNPSAAVSSTGASSTGASATPEPSTSGTTTRTVTGDAADTQYGPVQVQVTVTGGRITAATAVEYPMNDPRDAQINSYAIPALSQETVAANSANIDMVSGATYTSEGYITSLQSALNKARG